MELCLEQFFSRFLQYLFIGFIVLISSRQYIHKSKPVELDKPVDPITSKKGCTNTIITEPTIKRKICTVP